MQILLLIYYFIYILIFYKNIILIIIKQHRNINRIFFNEFSFLMKIDNNSLTINNY